MSWEVSHYLLINSVTLADLKVIHFSLQEYLQGIFNPFPSVFIQNEL